MRSICCTLGLILIATPAPVHGQQSPAPSDATPSRTSPPIAANAGAPTPIVPDTASLSTLRPLADRGDTRAALLLGRMHAEGHGVPASRAAGLAVLRRSALAAEPDALAHVGYRFLIADAFPGYDPTEARRWFTAAADRGSAQGAFGLGLLHKHGRGVPQSDSAAATWFRRAAEDGMQAAELLLATLHDNPRSPLHDPAAADRAYARLHRSGGSALIWPWVNAYTGGPGEGHPVPIDAAEAARLRQRMPHTTAGGGG
jgi:uncharacterized protein